jgi:type II secretory pathway pseudopilin PulG
MHDHFYELDPAQVRVNQPLQWDVFSAQGKLLLHKGSVIHSELQRDRLLELGVCVSRADMPKQKFEAPARVYDPFYEWQDLCGRLMRMNLGFIEASRAPAPAAAPRLLADLDRIADRVIALVVKAPDIAIFEIMQMDMANYTVAHHLQAAALCALIAQKLAWSADAARNACRAALTMNVAMLDLQTVLSGQQQPVTQAQREAIRDHGLHGRRLLEALGVGDQDWLQAIEQHHPERLPPGMQVSSLANLVHHVDIYLAKISPRAYRGAKTPQSAARELLQDARGDKGLVSMLIKIVGIYPPGTYVRLACGEIAVVVRRGVNAHTPRVCSLMSTAGMPLGEPVPRDTTLSKFAIDSIVGKARVMVLVDPGRLFGAG